jgi:8-oxo-dGTP pyrophosphatase MutT (NUDIX family)
MNKEELLSRARDPKYIPGIYNYCDRWCERCPFASRCLNCELVEAQFGDLESVDMSNEKFWNKFSEVLQLTMDMIKEMAEELGIDLDALEEDEILKKDSPVPDIIDHLSKKYASSVNTWFETNQYLILEEENSGDLRLACHQDERDEIEVKVADAVEIIRWYQYFIHVKLHRACDNDDEETDDDGFPKDSDGSAKVALIGIDRSIAAWKILLPHLAPQHSQTIQLIEMLENLKIRVEKRFPDARAFVRPGFDEIGN